MFNDELTDSILISQTYYLSFFEKEKRTKRRHRNKGKAEMRTEGKERIKTKERILLVTLEWLRKHISAEPIP
jgi:hypothetical protein